MHSGEAKPWLVHYPPEIPESLEYPDVTLTHFLEDAYQTKPNHVAIRFLGKSVTYRELYRSAVACAHMLIQLGIRPGDRVAIMLPNSPQAVISYYGILMAGAIVVQTNPLYVERELEHQLKDCGAKAVIAIDLVYPKIAKVQTKTLIQHIILTSIKDYLPFPKNLLYPLVQRKQPIRVSVSYGKYILSFVEQLQNYYGKTAPALEKDPDEIAILQYTGGTTGLPKGVKLTHRNLVVNTYQCKLWIYKSRYAEEKILGIVPFFHVYGMTTVMNLSILLASTMVLLPKFDVKDAIKTIHKEKPTLFPGAPTLYIALINYPGLEDYDLSSIKACISGSAPLPKEIQQRFEKITEGNLVEGYGLTETSPVTHANLIYNDKKVYGSIGIPWPDTIATVLSLDTREEVAPNEIGEIAIKGPQVMLGYWNLPQETEEAFHDGWFLTGDLGYMDEKGYFYIVDRKKDMIIAGGYNIYPREIEEVLFEHPDILECCVAGVQDDYRGETVKAFIVLKKHSSLTEEELDKYCRKKLAAYKVPRRYEFREELPKSIVGKVLRRVLVEEDEKKRKDS